MSQNCAQVPAIVIQVLITYCLYNQYLNNYSLKSKSASLARRIFPFGALVIENKKLKNKKLESEIGCVMCVAKW